MSFHVVSPGFVGAFSLPKNNAIVSTDVLQALRNIYDNLPVDFDPQSHLATRSFLSSHDTTDFLLDLASESLEAGQAASIDKNSLTSLLMLENKASSIEDMRSEASTIEWRGGSSTQDRFSPTPIGDAPNTDISIKRGFKPPSSKRQQLIAEEAIEIYMLRPRTKKGRSLRRGSMVKCKAIAPKYGVTPKTIRDIWRGRTLIQATEHLWTEEERIQRAQDDSSSDDEEEGTEADRRPSPTRARARPSASKGAPAASSRQDALHCPRGHRIPTRPCRHSGRH